MFCSLYLICETCKQLLGIMALKSANKYQIIWQCHNFRSILTDNFQHHPFLYRIKISAAETNDLLRLSNLPFISIFTILHDQASEKYLYFIKLCNTCSLTKFQGIPKFIPSSPCSPWLPFFSRGKIRTKYVRFLNIPGFHRVLIMPK